MTNQTAVRRSFWALIGHVSPAPPFRTILYFKHRLLMYLGFCIYQEQFRQHKSEVIRNSPRQTLAATIAKSCIPRVTVFASTPTSGRYQEAKTKQRRVFGQFGRSKTRQAHNRLYIQQMELLSKLNLATRECRQDRNR